MKFIDSTMIREAVDEDQDDTVVQFVSPANIAVAVGPFAEERYWCHAEGIAGRGEDEASLTVGRQ